MPERDIEASYSHIPYVTGCGIYFYQYFIVFGNRFVYLSELKNFWRPVFCAYNRFYGILLCADLRALASGILISLTPCVPLSMFKSLSLSLYEREKFSPFRKGGLRGIPPGAPPLQTTPNKLPLANYSEYICYMTLIAIQMMEITNMTKHTTASNRR